MGDRNRTPRTLYAVALSAARPGGDGAWTSDCEVLLTVARSAKEAERRHREASLLTYPPERGWRGHRVAIKPITRREVDFLIGYIAL